MNTFILIMFVATSTSSQSGAASVTQEFSSYERCMVAGAMIVADVERRRNYVLSWGCAQK